MLAIWSKTCCRETTDELGGGKEKKWKGRKKGERRLANKKGREMQGNTKQGGASRRVKVERQ